LTPWGELWHQMVMYLSILQEVKYVRTVEWVAMDSLYNLDSIMTYLQSKNNMYVHTLLDDSIHLNVSKNKSPEKCKYVIILWSQFAFLTRFRHKNGGFVSDSKLPVFLPIFGAKICMHKPIPSTLENIRSILCCNFLRLPTDKLFVHEWAKLRYGVFEEHGYPGDSQVRNPTISFSSSYIDAEGHTLPQVHRNG
jgi:hypothetical protein